MPAIYEVYLECDICGEILAGVAYKQESSDLVKDSGWSIIQVSADQELVWCPRCTESQGLSGDGGANNETNAAP